MRPRHAWSEDSKVTVQKDVAYLPEGRKEKADLYLPMDDGTQHPAVRHRARWRLERRARRDAGREINIGTTLASHGYVCMSIDYLLVRSEQEVRLLAAESARLQDGGALAAGECREAARGHERTLAPSAVPQAAISSPCWP